MNSSLALQVIAATAVIAAIPIAASAAVPGQEQLKGTVTAFNGKYSLHIENTKSKNVDAVQLHQGTIINPTGLTLRPGMKVTILAPRVSMACSMRTKSIRRTTSRMTRASGTVAMGATVGTAATARATVSVRASDTADSTADRSSRARSSAPD